MRIEHGRVMQPKEYWEARPGRHEQSLKWLKVVAQRSGPRWYLYLVDGRLDGAVVTVREVEEGEAEMAVRVGAEVLVAYQKMLER